jgi:hypothetical protein
MKLFVLEIPTKNILISKVNFLIHSSLRHASIIVSRNVYSTTSSVNDNEHNYVYFQSFIHSFNSVVIVSYTKELKNPFKTLRPRGFKKRMKNRDLCETCFCMQTYSRNFRQKIILTEFMTNDFFIRCDFLSQSRDSLLYQAFFIAYIFGMSWYVTFAICILTKVRNVSFLSFVDLFSFSEKKILSRWHSVKLNEEKFSCEIEICIKKRLIMRAF